LGVFFRLFTLLEDECHKLDIELAARKSPNERDKSSYVSYAAKVHQERTLLDQKDILVEELKVLHQTLSYLALHTTTTSTNPPHATTPSTNPAIVAVANVLKGRKEKLKDLVRFNNPAYLIDCHNTTGERAGHPTDQKSTKKGWSICAQPGQNPGHFPCV
jgi:hypothetical protein